MYPTINADKLCETLAAIPPVDLLGLRLLQSAPLDGLFPTGLPRATLTAAVVELVDYTRRCARAISQLADLQPIALTAVPQWQFGL